MVEPVGDRVRLFHRCGNVVRVDNPTSAQVRWNVRTHRCGPIGSAWQIGPQAAPIVGGRS